MLGHRRLLAACCAALAVLTAVRANAAPPPPRIPVVVATHDLGGGQRLSADDLTVARFAPGTTPHGADGDPSVLVGRTTSGPLREGEPLTDTRLLGGSLLRGYAGLVAAPVRIADAQAVGLLRLGDHIDIIAADPDGPGDAQTIAAEVPVVALPRTAGGTDQLTGGRLIVVAVSSTSAGVLAAAQATKVLSLVITR